MAVFNSQTLNLLLLKMQRDTLIFCTFLAVAVGAFVTLMVGVDYFKYGLDHKYTPDDLVAATKQAWSMCQNTHCFVTNQHNCTLFNLEMTELIHRPDVASLEKICEKLCPPSENCTLIESVFCQNACENEWSNLLDVEGHTATDGAEQYRKGVIMMSAGGSVLGVLALSMILSMYCEGQRMVRLVRLMAQNDNARVHLGHSEPSVNAEPRVNAERPLEAVEQKASATSDIHLQVLGSDMPAKQTDAYVEQP